MYRMHSTHTRPTPPSLPLSLLSSTPSDILPTFMSFPTRILMTLNGHIYFSRIVVHTLGAIIILLFIIFLSYLYQGSGWFYISRDTQNYRQALCTVCGQVRDYRVLSGTQSKISFEEFYIDSGNKCIFSTQYYFSFLKILQLSSISSKESESYGALSKDGREAHAPVSVSIGSPNSIPCTASHYKELGVHWFPLLHVIYVTDSHTPWYHS